MSLLASLVACRYGFVPEGAKAGKVVALEPSVNRTHLLEAGMLLDAELERAFAAMGMLAAGDTGQRISCTVVSARRERITTGSLASLDRYRLFIGVLVRMSDPAGKVVWQKTFSDQGVFSEGEPDETALEEACRQVSLQIARAVATLRP